MTIYGALQLGAAGSKCLIKESQSRREKIKWSTVYAIKVILTLLFCMLVVTTFSIFFGENNSITGVSILLILLLVRQADFGVNMRSSVLVMFLVFCILGTGPKLANLLPPWGAFFLHAFCILLITILSCHNIIMCNHFTFLLSYLLLYGYDVSGRDYINRLAALGVGFVVCSLIFCVKHRNHFFKRSFLHLFDEFDVHSTRTQWQLRISFSIASAMLVASLFHLPRVMWVGIACMSIMTPLVKDCAFRAMRRVPFNMVGCLLFLLLYNILPASLQDYLGILGGIGVSFSVSYSSQNMFNTLGALSVAASIFGLYPAILLRITANVLATVYCMGFNIVWEGIRTKIPYFKKVEA